jgi:hypothetical protein
MKNHCCQVYNDHGVSLIIIGTCRVGALPPYLCIRNMATSRLSSSLHKTKKPRLALAWSRHPRSERARSLSLSLALGSLTVHCQTCTGLRPRAAANRFRRRRRGGEQLPGFLSVCVCVCAWAGRGRGRGRGRGGRRPWKRCPWTVLHTHTHARAPTPQAHMSCRTHHPTLYTLPPSPPSPSLPLSFVSSVTS